MCGVEVVVEVEVAGQGLGAPSGGVEGEGVIPLTEDGLDEPLGFAVGARSVAAGAAVMEAEIAVTAGRDAGLVAGTVVSGRH